MSRRRTRSRWAAILGLAAVAGCLGLDTGPGFQIFQSVVASGEALPQSATARGNAGSATVSGVIVGQLPCDTISGDVEESGDDLFLTIVMISGEQGCHGVTPTTFSYAANVLGLDPGARGIIVEHQFRGTDGQTAVVLDTVVTVN